MVGRSRNIILRGKVLLIKEGSIKQLPLWCCTVCTMHHICEEELRDETGQYIKLSVIANTAQLLQISLQFADLLTDSNVALRYSMVYIFLYTNRHKKVPLTKTKTKCLKYQTFAIFLEKKTGGLKDIKYDIHSDHIEWPFLVTTLSGHF